MEAGKREFNKNGGGQQRQQHAKKKKKYSNSQWSTTASHNATPPRPPAYKYLPGTRILVDGFSFAHSSTSNTYVLTHFHSDHYTTLGASFSAGKIYCTPETARLVTAFLGVSPAHVVPIPYSSPFTFPPTPDLKNHAVTMTLHDANHCPGAAVCLFTLRKASSTPLRTILHTGDFRWDRGAFSAVAGIRRMNEGSVRLDELYLDTTYCHEKHSFPPQAAAVRAAVDLVEEESRRGKTLFVFGAYTIGKERCHTAAATSLGVRVHVDPRRLRMMSCCFDGRHVDATYTSEKSETNVWVRPMGHVVASRLQEVLSEANASLPALGGKYERVVGIRPTGWSHKPSKASISPRLPWAPAPAPAPACPVTKTARGKVTVASLPYSEHSSFEELVDCVAYLMPGRIVPTVSVGDKEQVGRLIEGVKKRLEGGGE